MKVTVNGKELSADEYKSFRLRINRHGPAKRKKMMIQKRMMKKDTYMCEDCKKRKPCVKIVRKTIHKIIIN